MRKLLALVALLSLAGIGWADDETIVKGLRAQEIAVIYCPEESWVVIANVDTFNAAVSELCEFRGNLGVQVNLSNYTDPQLRRVCALPVLRQLFLNDQPVTDDRLKIVVKARRLQSLSLSNTSITDAGLADLVTLRELQNLYLDGNAITDAGLRHLERLSGLTCLHLFRCPNVTDAGVARLEKALPNCAIRH